MRLLRQITPAEAMASAAPSPIDDDTLERARPIVDDVRSGGYASMLRWAEQLGDLGPEDPVVFESDALQAALDSIASDDRGVLERTAERIRTFAAAQRRSIEELTFPIPGGACGHRVAPVETAGCYAPGGRYPLPSSVLMTAVTARAAGVERVWVASPRPTTITLAAAAVAGADALLAVGGAHAIAALAYGAGSVPRCDVIVGPGNRWVTAAKSIVSRDVGIDMLAGPSELVVVADETAEPETVAADLLAQAEHDDDARPILIALSPRIGDAVEKALVAQLETLPTAETARAALVNGFSVVARDLDEAARISDRIAPEHLQISLQDAERAAVRFRHYGGVFVGERSAEVLGDYGAGPNHTLPTGGVARFSAGLSVMHFLRLQTWLRLDRPDEAATLHDDAVALARMEGLEAHARAAERRGTDAR
jgi:histidinol dehydrogenase